MDKLQTYPKWLIRTLFMTVILIMCLGWLIVTPLGFKLTLHAAKRILPLELKVKHAHGRWIGPIDIHQLSLHLDGATVKFNRAYLNWHPSALLHGHLRISQLSIRDLAITATHKTKEPASDAATKTAADKPSTSTSLPLAVEIQQSDVRNITITGYTELPLKISRITLHAIADEQGINGQFGFDAQFPAIHGSARLAGNLNDYQIQTHVQSQQFDIQAQGHGNQSGTNITLDKGKLLDGEVAVKTHIQWQPTLKWQVEVAANKIKDILPSGTTHSEINLNLKAHGEPAKNEITVDIPSITGLWRGAPLDGKLYFKQMAEQRISRGNITLANAKINFNANIDEQLAIQWQADIPRLYTLSQQAKGSIKMNGVIKGSRTAPNTDIQFSGQHIATKFMSAEQATATIHIDGSHPQQSIGKLQIDNMAYKTFLIDTTQLLFHRGTAHDTLKLDIQKDRQSVHLNLAGKLDDDHVWKGNLTHFDIKSPDLNWALDELTPITLSRHKITIDPICIKPDQGSLCLKSQWQRDEGWQLKFNADNISGQALAVLLPTEDIVQNLAGTLNGDIQFDGKNSRLTSAEGTIHLSDLQAFIKPADTTFKNGDILLTGDGNTLSLKADIHSQQGPLAIIGKITLGTNIMSELQIKGQQFQASNSNFLKLSISPNLQLSGTNQDLTFTGNLAIDSAHINKQRFSHVATLPGEITYLHLMDHTAPPLIKLQGAIDVDLGNDSHVNLSGLTGKIIGKLNIQHSLEGNLTANGQLSLRDGHYSAHGQNLTISKGEITFLGDSISNPRLDVAAERTIDLTNQVGEINTDLTAEMLTVGVTVTGTVSNNTVKLFSHPLKLSDMAILSYLVTGQPGSSNPTGNYGTMALLALNSFASSNSLSDTVDKTEKLQDSTLLDEFAITQEEDYGDAAGESTGTMITLGKRLTPKLFLKYRFGLSSEEYTISATYQLTRHYAAQLYSKLLGNGFNIIYRN